MAYARGTPVDITVTVDEAVASPTTQQEAQFALYATAWTRQEA